MFLKYQGIKTLLTNSDLPNILSQNPVTVLSETTVLQDLLMELLHQYIVTEIIVTIWPATL